MMNQQQQYKQYLHNQRHQQLEHHQQQLHVHSGHFTASNKFWLDGDVHEEPLGSKITQRRVKRTIPEAEKDEKYWEKRKRNNMAAKRSRENKRVLENDIKHKVSCYDPARSPGDSLLVTNINVSMRSFA